MALSRVKPFCQLGQMVKTTFYSANIRTASSEVPSTKIIKPEDQAVQESEEVYDHSYLDKIDIKNWELPTVPEVPIKSLNILDRAEKVKKTGSFTVDLFKGSYDHDFLIYPEPLRTRDENFELQAQATMVNQLFPRIWDDQKELQQFNFFNLYQLSVNEMMTIFEAIGRSARKCYEVQMPATKFSDSSLVKQVQVSRSIISLITRNCLTYWPIHKYRENDDLKEYLPKRHILFGGSKGVEDVYPPIGFCWTEQAELLGALPPQEWLTTGQDGGPSLNHYLITGKKTRVLKDDNTENFLFFYRDKELSAAHEQKEMSDQPNPASDPFVGCCLVKRNELDFGPTYKDSAGFQYTDVNIDTMIPSKRLVFAAQRKDPRPVNIKALGQLASCAVVTGILKDATRMTYKHLLESKRGILNCDIVERTLTNVTCKIFTLESMIYYIAGMYDGLEEGFDAHMESTVLKIVTNEHAYSVLKDLQSICGSDMFIISKLQDQINIFDSFLDGNLYNRLYLSTMGIIWFARSQNMHLNKLRLAPWYPGYFIKSMLRERSEKGDYLTLDADIHGHLHPSLKDAADHLQYMVKRVKYAAVNICMKHGKDVTSAQTSLYRLSQLVSDCFALTAVCARASKAYCHGTRNAEMDVAIATTIAHSKVKEARFYMEELQSQPINSMDNRAPVINELNLKMGGYYAESPLDTNF